jgi:hypothetical protein
MLERLDLVWVGLLFAGAASWMVLLQRLIRLLRNDHPAVYSAIGHPTLFLNNSLANGFLMFKFVFGGERAINDHRVRKLCRILRVFFISYALLLIVPIVVLMARGRLG